MNKHLPDNPSRGFYQPLHRPPPSLSLYSCPSIIFCGRPESYHHHARDSGLTIPVPALLVLSFLGAPPLAPSCALRSRKWAQRSDKDSLSFVEVGSEKISALSEGELGVRWKGDAGRRRLLPEVPGRARPACSRCSSVQLR